MGEKMLMTADGLAERTAVADMIIRRDSALRHSAAVQAQVGLVPDGLPDAAGDIGPQRPQTLPGNCGIREQFMGGEGAPRLSAARGPIGRFAILERCFCRCVCPRSLLKSQRLVTS